jgi:hypothetical protein
MGQAFASLPSQLEFKVSARSQNSRVIQDRKRLTRYDSKTQTSFPTFRRWYRQQRDQAGGCQVSVRVGKDILIRGNEG